MTGQVRNVKSMLRRERRRSWVVISLLVVLLMTGCTVARPAGTPRAASQPEESRPVGAATGQTGADSPVQPAAEGPVSGTAPKESVPADPLPTELKATALKLEPFRRPEEWIALAPDGLYLAEAATGKVLRLYQSPYAAVSWSRDGSMALAYQGDKAEMDLLDLRAGTGIRLSGVDPWEAALAPDGKGIAFTREGFRNGQTAVDGLYLVGTDGTGLRTVTTEERIHGLSWSKDGRRLAFQAPVKDGKQEAWSLDVRILDVASGQVTSLGPVYLGSYVWSPDGREMALASRAGLTVVTLATGARREIPWSFEQGQSAVWSPDGKWFVATQYQQGTPGWSLLSYPADGSGPLRTLAKVMPGLAWAPDGSRLAYVAFGCESQDFGLYTMKPDGTDGKRLSGAAPAPARTQPFWSPDGKTIASAVVQKVLLTDPVTGTERALVQDDSAFWFARLQGWSPDGRYVAFANGVGKGYCD